MSALSIVLRNKGIQISPRILSVDYGSKRVGLAKADPLYLFAQPLDTCSPSSSISRLVSFHKKDPIGVIVIGWPLHEDGTEGEATERVNRYISQLQKRLPEVEIIRWDERYTSEEAKSRLISRHKKKRYGQIDQIAACIILQEYLDSLSKPPDSMDVRAKKLI